MAKASAINPKALDQSGVSIPSAGTSTSSGGLASQVSNKDQSQLNNTIANAKGAIQAQGGTSPGQEMVTFYPPGSTSPIVTTKEDYVTNYANNPAALQNTKTPAIMNSGTSPNNGFKHIGDPGAGYNVNTPQVSTQPMKYDYMGNLLGPGGQVMSNSKPGPTKSLNPGESFNSDTREVFNPYTNERTYMGPNSEASGANIVNTGTRAVDTPIQKPTLDRHNKAFNALGANAGPIVYPDTKKTGDAIQDLFPNVGRGSQDSTANTGDGSGFNFATSQTKAGIYPGKGPQTVRSVLGDQSIQEGSIQGEGFAFKGYGTDKAAAEQAKAQADATFQQGGVSGIETVVRQGKHGNWNLVFKRNPNTTAFDTKEPPGNQENISQQTDTVNSVNEGIRNLIDKLLPIIIASQNTQGKTFDTAAQGLQREIPGVGETSPQQEAMVQKAVQDFIQRGQITRDRTVAQQYRTTAADLRNSGFASSNLAGQVLDEGPAESGRQLDERLMLDSGQYEQQVRNDLANRQNAGVDTLAKIGAPQFPGNMPQPAQLQEGTFQKVPTLDEQTQLLQLISYLMPKADQDAKLKIMQEFLGNSVVPVSNSSPFSDITGAIGNVMSGGRIPKASSATGRKI